MGQILYRSYVPVVPSSLLTPLSFIAPSTSIPTFFLPLLTDWKWIVRRRKRPRWWSPRRTQLSNPIPIYTRPIPNKRQILHRKIQRIHQRPQSILHHPLRNHSNASSTPQTIHRSFIRIRTNGIFIVE